MREGQKNLSNPVKPYKPTDAHSISIVIETALLAKDSNHLAAVRLALKTKRLPLTKDDLRISQDKNQSLYERFSSGLSEIPIEDYYDHFTKCEFTKETLRVARFLVNNRRVFKECAAAGPADDKQVSELAALCKNENKDSSLLRALFVFTCADRSVWESEEEYPARWFTMRELYFKACNHFAPSIDQTPIVLKASGFHGTHQKEILTDLGKDFFSGAYGKYAIRFGSHLVKLAECASLLAPNPTSRIRGLKRLFLALHRPGARYFPRSIFQKCL